MDIRPPRRRQSPVQSEQSSDTPLSLAAPESVLPDVSFATEADSATPPQPRRRIGKKVGIIFGSLLLVLAAAGAAVYLSYQSQLGPVNAASKDHVRITIVSGTTPAQIATLLHDKKLIQSTRVFDIYTRITQTRHKLQAGSYSLSPAQSLSEIVDYLVSGKADQFKITFYTGGTLQAAPGADDSKKTDVETMLLRAGFSQADVSAALAASYASPLFAGRPAGASLEGYVYGDTYLIDGSTTVTQLLTLVFKTYNDAINDTDILAGLEAQGLNLYEGITLASIVQAEMGAY